MCIVSLFCVKKQNNQKQKNQMFIFYVSLTLCKLLSDCQEKNNGVFSDHCYFCKVSVCAHAVAESRECVLSPDRVMFVTRTVTVYRIFFFIPHLGFSVAPGQKAHETCGWQHGPWLSEGPVAGIVALRGIYG